MPLRVSGRSRIVEQTAAPASSEEREVASDDTTEPRTAAPLLGRSTDGNVAALVDDNAYGGGRAGDVARHADGLDHHRRLPMSAGVLGSVALSVKRGQVAASVHETLVRFPVPGTSAGADHAEPLNFIARPRGRPPDRSPTIHTTPRLAPTRGVIDLR